MRYMFAGYYIVDCENLGEAIDGAKKIRPRAEAGKVASRFARLSKFRRSNATASGHGAVS